MEIFRIPIQMTLISTIMLCSIYLLLLPAELVMFAKGRGIGLPDLVPPRFLSLPLLNMYPLFSKRALHQKKAKF